MQIKVTKYLIFFDGKMDFCCLIKTKIASLVEILQIGDSPGAMTMV